ncbi:hypothetical protein Adi01nite_33590 [Amorphoplanes digitatis]|nr:hypothetical protein Adi01nite_33590 [Actinoplanes digitatis]
MTHFTFACRRRPRPGGGYGRRFIADVPDRRLVPLCLEKLETGVWCHRGMFAEWWTEHTAGTARELVAAAARSRARCRSLCRR